MLIDTAAHGTLNVLRAGPIAAPTLLFMHPVGLDSTWWGDQIAAFALDYDVVAIDMPGHGRSPTMVEPPTFDRLADATAAVLEALGIGHVDVIGLSFGGMIAQTLAVRRPDLVRSLLLVGTAHTAPEPMRAALRQRAAAARDHGMAYIAPLTLDRWFASGFSGRRPDVLDRAAMSLMRQDASVHGAIWDMIADLDLSEHVGTIECPVLVMAGAEDVNTPVPIVQALAGALHDAPVEMMNGVGHFPPFEAPERFNRTLKRFLEGSGKHADGQG